MTIGETVRKAIKEISEGMLDLIGPKDFKLTDDDCCGGGCKPKRARTKKGTYKGDDKSTKDINEAWVGGKAPKKKIYKIGGKRYTLKKRIKSR